MAKIETYTCDYCHDKLDLVSCGHHKRPAGFRIEEEWDLTIQDMQDKQTGSSGDAGVEHFCSPICFSQAMFDWATALQNVTVVPKEEFE